jgi:hypothetical protein
VSDGPSKSSFSFDMKRWSQAERTTAIATFVLLISLFLPWYTVSFGFASGSVNGLWHGWTYLVLLLCLAILVYLVSSAGFSEMPFKMPITGYQLLLFGSAANVVLIVLAFIDKPGGGGVGWGFGAFIGLVAAIVAAVPLGVPALKARKG